ncbi:MAG: elongation factor 4, partial [Parcubacteria group bacterium]|nr:elongation factor 4 [Parcubacteria group bacterium]
KNIRNFSIIAHIDHGKSTLADRMLELTGTIEKRKMREQALDTMDLERERGITIKMTPVRMNYRLKTNDYRLNLIDTPGHIDFAYEVSRALKAVDGALLLVDATQGVQAQTLSVLEMARELGLAIIPVVSKIDSPLARTDEVVEELARLLDVAEEEVVLVSGKTGEGVPELLRQIISRIPPPGLRESASAPRALVFDFEYSTHRGIVVYVRIFSGALKKGDDLKFAVTGMRFKALEVGTLGPAQFETTELIAGEIGYVVTGAKEAARAVVGDTVTSFLSPASALSGYKNPQPVVWASLFPEGQDDFSALKMALEELKLEDPSLAFEEELSPVLGRGFRSGFLGMLHLEIILERLKREFGTRLIVASPSIVYEIVKENGERNFVYSPAEFPDYGAYKEIYEPVAEAHIITPIGYTGAVIQALYRHEAVVGESENWSGNRVSFKAKLPLRELMRGFFDELKNVSSGYASFSYEIVGSQKADVVRLDILVADERVPAFSQVIARATAYDEAKHAVERLYEILPRQLFVTKIQGVAQGRILSSKTLSALKKDVTGYLYGGDITRKKKLWEKQKRGKKKMKERGTVEIPHDVFLKMLKKE